jgi:hypothetical protein
MPETLDEPSEIEHVRITLRGIHQALETFPRGNIYSINLENFIPKHETFKRHEAGDIRVAQLIGASVILFTTSRSLTDTSHRLIIPTDGNVEMFSRHINTNPQYLPGSEIYLVGPEQIAVDRDAVHVLDYGAGALAVEAVTGWTHAISPSTTPLRELNLIV